MSIWDNSTISLKCPNCAGNLVFDVSLAKNCCRSCGGLFMPETLEPSGNLEIRDKKPATDEEEDKIEFVCDQCGSVLVTDNTTAATFCAFCGSPTLIKRRLANEFRPDYIIPFKVTKEQAIENFRKYVADTKYAPSDFVDAEGIKKITGFMCRFGSCMQPVTLKSTAAALSIRDKRSPSSISTERSSSMSRMSLSMGRRR